MYVTAIKATKYDVGEIGIACEEDFYRAALDYSQDIETSHTVGKLIYHKDKGWRTSGDGPNVYFENAYVLSTKNRDKFINDRMQVLRDEIKHLKLSRAGYKGRLKQEIHAN